MRRQKTIDGLAIDGTKGTTLHRKVYRMILEMILSGDLTSGSSVPSTRRLSQHLRISRNCVIHAYEQLQAEGFLESTTGSGTFVSRCLPPSSVQRRRDMKIRSSNLKLRKLIALSGYPVEEVVFKDSEENSLYLFSSGK